MLSVLTFGGDRETFDFSDPDNFRRVDNDVWQFFPPLLSGYAAASGTVATEGSESLDAPSPSLMTAPLAFGSGEPRLFSSDLTLSFTLPEAGTVELTVYDTQGRQVQTLAREFMEAGIHRARWDGRSVDGHAVPAGVYFARLSQGGAFTVTRVVRLR